MTAAASTSTATNRMPPFIMQSAVVRSECSRPWTVADFVRILTSCSPIYIDVAVVAERLCEQMRLTPSETLDYLRARGCRIGGVTSGERGLLWYDGTNTVRLLTALPVPMQRIIDTSGAGDVFHGAYMHSYLTNPGLRWDDHFHFARAAAAHKIQHLGNEAGLPTLADIESIRHEFE
jgi:sugar/nucleoside kinase (ribokinase family)